MKKILFLLSFLFYISSAYTGSAALDCMVCHQTDIGSFPAIDTSLIGVHVNVNSTDGTGILTSLDCMACHYSVNTSGPHRIPVSIFPVSTYTCENCHVDGIVPSAPRVSNHNRNAALSVTADCVDCHNKTTNLFRFSASASAAHYGTNSSFGIPPGKTYCTFCHQNPSTGYKDVMQNPDNTRISNHTSSSIYPFHPAGVAPDCTSCHGQDKLHGKNIIKPVPSSGFCNNCHSSDPIPKNKHSGKVECIRCHTGTPSDIHNIKYIQPDGTYRAINVTGCISCHVSGSVKFRLPFPAANCTTCHQGSGLKMFPEALVLPPMNHSVNPYSGTLWNGSQPGYWGNTSSSCEYCHGQTLHNLNAFGKVENIRSGNLPDQNITNTSYWCANCHYKGGVPAGNYSYNGDLYSPVPPEIQDNSGLVPAKASDGTAFYNHSLGEYSDAACKACHGVNSPATTALFIHDVGTGGGGPDCISCHGSRSSGAPPDKRIDIDAFNKSVHYGLNGGGSSSCWACHGDGTKPSGHPAGYKTPKKCSNDECHSLDQKFRAPVIYSHFRNASLIDNPDNVINYNVTTSSDCQDCHVNSVNSRGMNINSTVSHFASGDLFDSINCIYCHINEDNSIKWGNATLIYENRTALVELNRENNKFTAREGESVDLGSGFRLKILEVSSVRNSVLMELIKKDIPVDKSLVSIGNYKYEEYLAIDNGSKKVPVIVINITGIFKGNDAGFIQFEGFRLKRVHPEKKTTSCYSCHVKAMQKTKYKVIERVSGEKDEIYYTKETVNFTDNKIFDETVVLQLLGALTDKDMHVAIQPEKRRSLFEGEAWNVSEGTSLVVREVDTKSEEAFLQLRTGGYVYEDIVRRGDIFEFTPSLNYLGNQPKNISIFRAKVSGIIQAKPKNMVILEEVAGISPEIRKIMENQTLDGYNASWLWENSTIHVGNIPENFHSPQLFDGKNGGADCLSCHGKDGFSVKKVLSLGKHDEIDGGGNNACRACHGGTKDIMSHPSGYKTPMTCVSCHASTVDNFSAIYIGDEEHKNGRCEDCHVSNIHEISRLHMTPAIKQISLIKEDNRTILRASASAGYKMKVREARYYVDLQPEKFRMYPVDGVFDSQIEEISAQIDLSKLSSGKHVVYIEAMERRNNWGVPSSLEFMVEGGSLKVTERKNTSMLTLEDTLAILLIVFVLRRFRMKKE